MGFLVHSFNDMTKRLRARARDQQRAQQAVETRARQPRGHPGAPVDGVISLEPDLRVRTANQAAGMILGEDLESCVGLKLGELGGEPSGRRAAAPVRRVLPARLAAATTSGASRSRSRRAPAAAS